MPAYRSSFWFDDSVLFVSREVWSNLTSDPSVVGFASVVAAATEAIKRQGAFAIDGGTAGILRRIDRAYEFSQFVQEVDEHRGELGLQRLS